MMSGMVHPLGYARLLHTIRFSSFFHLLKKVINVQVRKLQQRPIAALPRTPQFFVRFGPPMTAEDLSHDAPSVFVESRRLLDDVLERREKLQSSPDYVAPDTPFWRVPAKLRNKKPPKWQSMKEEGHELGGAEKPPENTFEAAEQLKGIVNIGRRPGGRRAEPLSPAKATSKLLQDEADESISHADGIAQSLSS